MARLYPQPELQFREEWQNHLRNISFILNIENIINIQTKEFAKIIREASAEQKEIIERSEQLISGTLDQGFSLLSENLKDLSNELKDVSYELNRFGSLLNWNLSILIEKQRITNLLLSDIALTSRISDSEKVRYDYISRGLKHLQNGLYENALKYLIKAEELDEEDYFVLHKIGIIYLYSLDHLDFINAKKYFLKAAKYAEAETQPGASIRINYLANNKDGLSQKPTINGIKQQTAESYLNAAICCYYQVKFQESIQYAENSISIYPNLLEAEFILAKAYSQLNENEKAAKVLYELIQKDRYYILRVPKDPDLISKKEIELILVKLNHTENFSAKFFYDSCKVAQIENSVVINEMALIKSLIDKNTYLHSRKAIDLMRCPKKREFGNNLFYEDSIDFQYLLESLTEINKFAIEPSNYKSYLDDIFNYLNIKTQWHFQNYYFRDDATQKYKIDFGSKIITSNLQEFLNKEKEYFENIDNVNDRIHRIIDEITQKDEDKKSDIETKNIETAKEDQWERIENSFKFAVIFGVLGAIAFALLGVFFGFFKSCNTDHNTPGFFIDGVWGATIHTFAFTGAIVGIIFGIIVGQKEPLSRKTK